MQPLNETALRTAVDGFVEPLMGLTLAEAGAVRSLQYADGTLSAEIVLGFPVAAMKRPSRRRSPPTCGDRAMRARCS